MDAPEVGGEGRLRPERAVLRPIGQQPLLAQNQSTVSIPMNGASTNAEVKQKLPSLVVDSELVMTQFTISLRGFDLV